MAGAGLRLRPASECRWDAVALGEVMLRFDPGEDRIARTRQFRVWEGGGEYNVVRGLRSCFALRTAVVTALVDNPVGRLVEDLVRQGGVDASEVLWRADDGVGRAARNGLYFLERGFGVRGAMGAMDRGHTAVSQIAPGEVDWERLFGEEGVRWLHTGGIFCALSGSTRAVALEAMAAAKRHGTAVSFDCNYRPSLWRAQGGRAGAIALNRELAAYVDVLFGHEGDLGLELTDAAAGPPVHTMETYAAMAKRLFAEHAALQVIATPTRRARTATVNDWGGYGATRYGSWAAPEMVGLEILDRVGGGDAFAAGVLYGLMNGKAMEWAVRCGVAHGALAMTTAGDSSFASLAEVERVMAGEGAGVRR